MASQEMNTQQEKMIVRLESSLQEANKARRKLHNILQEMKGNIRVFCRCSPPTHGKRLQKHF